MIFSLSVADSEFGAIRGLYSSIVVVSKMSNVV